MGKGDISNLPLEEISDLCQNTPEVEREMEEEL